MVLRQGPLGQGPLQMIPGEHPPQVPALVDDFLPGGRGGQVPACGGAVVAVAHGAMGRFPPPQAAVAPPSGGNHGSQSPVAAGEQGLDHAPAVAFRAQANALGLESFGEGFQALVGFGAHRFPLERGVGLGHKGADPQRQSQPWGGAAQGQQQLRRGLDVVIVFAGKAHHSIELEALEATIAGMAGGGMDFVAAELLVHQGPHAIAAAFNGDGQRLAAPGGEAGRQGWGNGGRPHRADADAEVIESRLAQPAK